MDRRRIVRAASLLMMLSTMACGAPETPPSPASQPVVTLPPETPTLAVPNTQQSPLVQIGYFSSIYLRYDPGVWEVFDETYGHQLLNEEGEPIRALHHLTIPGCTLHDNLGRGVPPTWEQQVTDRIIGGLEFRVEAWTDTEAQRQVLVVYQYPPGEATIGKRIELVVDRQPEECIEAAEDVLALSVDLISSP